jgi:hypothetical protein
LFFFSSIRPNILCIKDLFGGISPLRQYRINVLLSKDNKCVLSQESESVYCLRKVRQHKSDIFGYSNSETIQINTWYHLILSLLHHWYNSSFFFWAIL